MERGYWLKRCWKSFLMGLSVSLSVSVLPAQTLAQQSNIVPDNTLSAESSQVLPNYQGLPIEVITGGATRGINLFHSFREFNVSEGRGAYFSSPNADIQNILTRVTGSNRSEILGTLGILRGSSANLFLINPNGIVFGENASLDVQGSFVGTTANAVQFGEQGFFSATNPEVPQLLRVNPSAFLFNQINNQAEIRNSSIAPAGVDPAGFDAFGLRVPDGKSLLLLGGNVNVDGGVFNAFGGTVELGGLTEVGSVNLDVDGNSFKLSFPENIGRGDVLLTNQAGVLVYGDDGGDIVINARNLDISRESGIFAGIGFGLGISNSRAGDIDINVTEAVSLTDNSYIDNTLQRNAKGKAGDTRLSTNTLDMDNGGQIISATNAQGDSGNITVEARDRITLRNQKEGLYTGIFSIVDLYAQGNAGNINVETNLLEMYSRSALSGSTRGNGNSSQISIIIDNLFATNGAVIRTDTFANGNAGNILIEASDRISLKNSLIFTFVQQNARGNGGDLQINTGVLELFESEFLALTNVDGIGDAGNIIINARENILLEQANIFSTVEIGGIGNGGNISVTGRELIMNQGSLQTSVGVNSRNFVAGKGNAGDIYLDIQETVKIVGTGTGLYSFVEEGTVGNGGNINIKTGSFSISNGAELIASILGKGSAGNIDIDARENITFGKGYAYSTVGYLGEGKGGDINIKAGSLFFTNGTEIAVSTFGIGSAGNLRLDARENILFDNARAYSTVVENAIGNGGEIRINTGNISIINDAFLNAATYGQGSSANVNIDARERIFLDKGSIFSGVIENAVGNGGTIRISTNFLSLNNKSQIQTSTFGRGNAGNIIIDARDRISLNEESFALSQIRQGGVGKGGDIRVNTGLLSLTNGAQFTASTFGEGEAGNIQIQANDSIYITGRGISEGFTSGLYSTTNENSIGKGGNITIDTKNFRLSEGALLSTRTRTDSQGGNITVNADNLEVINGGQVLTTTSSIGRAGAISINATKGVVIDGSDANFNDRIARFPDILDDREATANSGLFVSSTSTGTTGDISITSPKITLDNGGRINAESASGNGGNINLTVSDLLLMRRGGQISTNAGTAQQGGDGGNIDINSRFIVAVPDENNDITANAFTGTGGKVEITSLGVFGIEPRPRANDITSDITASSEQGVQGVTAINAPDNSALQNSLNQLSDNPIDANALIANSCIARRNTPQGGTFFITGKGGLPERPGEGGISRFSTGEMQGVRGENPSSNTRPRWKIGDPIVEPTGVYTLANGKRILGRECD